MTTEGWFLSRRTSSSMTDRWWLREALPKLRLRGHNTQQRVTSGPIQMSVDGSNHVNTPALGNWVPQKACPRFQPRVWIGPGSRSDPDSLLSSRRVQMT